jgi:hypothetical protein
MFSVSSRTGKALHGEMKERAAVSALLMSDLSWTDLLQRMSLSKNTLAAVVRAQKQSGDLTYSLREGKTGKPRIIYSLSDAGRKKHEKAISVLEKVTYAEQLSAKSLAAKKKIFSK